MTDFIDDKDDRNDRNDSTTVGSDSLPQWASITTISRHLGIARSTISAVVKSAWDRQEPWVKKVQGEKTSYYQIDTQHEQYLAHVKHWLAQQEQDEQDTQQAQEPPEIFVDTSFPWLEYNLFNHGMQFRQWLHDQGIQIFQNLLSDGLHQPWDWRWDQLHGEGYASDEQAVIALLQANSDMLISQIQAYEHQIEEYQGQLEGYRRQTQHLHEALRQAQEFPQKHSWFGKGK